MPLFKNVSFQPLRYRSINRYYVMGVGSDRCEKSHTALPVSRFWRLALSTANAQDKVKIRDHPSILRPIRRHRRAGGQRHQALREAARRDGCGQEIKFVRKDTGGIAPDIAKRLAQELIVRDGADLLAGFVLTPNALAAADISAEAKKFMVVMNAATSIITTKSPYITRTLNDNADVERLARRLGREERDQANLLYGFRLRS